MNCICSWVGAAICLLLWAIANKFAGVRVGCGVLCRCNGLAFVATVTRWLKATGSLDDLKEMKRCLGSGTRLVYHLILLNLKVLST